ncbi:MAG: hypothetical protein BWK76_24130 [Desulfobulbaceae bacterium A2]|nr:MAG: hypothetical protein BWK76_24130 [Desulfobulbaceae bacterium A2]
MRALPALVLLASLLGACAAPAPPALTPLPGPAWEERCRSVYPNGDWQFVHAIEFALADGAGGTAIGVTTLSGGEIACALLTVEGLCVFEARQPQEGDLDIRRALPPFDKPGFAAGLLDDVRTIFLPPAGAAVVHGRIGVEPVCRHMGADGRVSDVLPEAAGCWQIRTYRQGRGERLLETTTCRPEGPGRIPQQLVLHGLGRSGYTLRMTLIRAEQGAPSTFMTETLR